MMAREVVASYLLSRVADNINRDKKSDLMLEKTVT